MSSFQPNDSTPLVKQSRKPLAQICKFPGSGNDSKIIKLLDSLPRFGPFYSKDDSFQSVKDEAWQHILKTSPEREAVTTEFYLGAVRKVEKQARETYADDDSINNLTGSQFRWLMIKDGCFFLQLALLVLGGSEHLGYSSDHKIFGQKPNLRGWIRSIFFVGNQIPLVVLRELMKQSFFQNVIAQGKWEQPKVNLCKIVLYINLLVPALENRVITPLERFFGRSPASPPPASDILHVLYLLVVGPEVKTDKTDDDEEEEEEKDDDDDKKEDRDLEAQRTAGVHQEGPAEATLGHLLPISDEEEFVVIGNIKDRKFSSAAKLRQAGVHYKSEENKGSRGINFSRASLTLPPFFVDEYTRILFRSLKDYERVQQFSENEVKSYLRFISELIRTPEDTKLLAKKKIIRGQQKHQDKLPDILGRLAPRELYNQHFRLVKVKANNYSRPPWAYFKKYVELAVLLTLIQTVYAVLSYHIPKK